MRVNARFDDQRAEKLRLIQSLTGMSASDVLKHAIDLLHERQVTHAKTRVDALLTSDLIGCSDGPGDLADQYKHYLSEDLNNKHGAR